MVRIIFGCGYVGLRVARGWVGQSDSVYAITRSENRFQELRKAGIQPLLADVTDPDSLTAVRSLPVPDTVLIAIGFDRKRYDDIRDVYVDGLRNLLACLPEGCGQIVYVSSTGVYGQTEGGTVDESSETQPTRPGGVACLEAEGLLKSSRFADRTTILRFAGIYGAGRVPGQRYFESGSYEKISTQGWLNLIHVDDGVDVVLESSEPKNADWRGETFVVSDGNPADRGEYYSVLATRMGVPNHWLSKAKVEKGVAGKRLCNKKLLGRLGRPLKYPNFNLGLEQALKATE